MSCAVMIDLDKHMHAIDVEDARLKRLDEEADAFVTDTLGNFDKFMQAVDDYELRENSDLFGSLFYAAKNALKGKKTGGIDGVYMSAGAGNGIYDDLASELKRAWLEVHA